MDSGVIEGGLNVTLTIRLLMHGKVGNHAKFLVVMMMIMTVIIITNGDLMRPAPANL